MNESKKEQRMDKAREMADGVTHLGLETYTHLYSYRAIHHELAARPELNCDGFWNTTWIAYLNSAILGIGKLLENRNDSVNLGNFLVKCASCIRYLGDDEQQKQLGVSLGQQERELRYIRVKFKDWRDLRNKQVAHSQFRWEEQPEILLSEARDLLKEAFHLVQFWKRQLDLGVELTRLAIGADTMVYSIIRQLEIAHDYLHATRRGEEPENLMTPWFNQQGRLTPPPESLELWDPFQESARSVRQRTADWFMGELPRERAPFM